jgi:SAM-dependent methyltransferase
MSVAPVPYPPLALANRVCSLENRGKPFAAYEKLGAEARAAITEMLPAGWSFDGKRVLDFGCGAGRTLRHFLTEAQAGDFWGSDIDAPSIAWLQQNLCPPLQAMQNSTDPPLGLEHGTFDLIWALSVFTHLTDNSLPWLAELHALLKPGGLLLATYMGRYNGELFTHEPWDENEVGMNVLRRRTQAWDAGGPVVLMSDWWVKAHWGRAFEFVGQAPVHGQTWTLLRKLDVQITADELAEPSNDPRELVALRRNLRQVEQDYERALAELRDEYELSISWRITRPLRTARTLARERRARSTI